MQRLNLHSRGVRAVSIGLCIIGSALLVTIVSSGTSRAASAYSLSPDAKRFPLWSALPVENFAVLREGTLKERRWGAYAFRRPTASAGACIQIVNLRQFGGGLSVFGGSASCGPLSVPKRSPIVSEVAYGGIGTTTVAIFVHPNVTTIRFKLEGGRELTRRTRSLSPAQARKARVRPSRYLAFAMNGFCPSAISGYEASGLLAFESPRAGCPA